MPRATLSATPNPRKWGFGLALNDTLFRTAVGPGREISVVTAPLEAPRVNTVTSPEEAAAEFGLVFARSQFSGGEGLFRAHTEGAAKDRFWDSRNVSVAPAESGEFPEIRLLHTTESVEETAGSNARIAYDDVSGSLYVCDGTTLRRSDNPTANPPAFSTDDPHLSEGSQTVEDITHLGSTVYAALGVNGIHRKQSGGSWEHWSDLSPAERVWGVKGRIVASDGDSIYEVTSSGAAPTALHTLSPDETWQDVADGGSFVLAAASDGYVYSFATDTGSLVLAAQSLFEGELPRCVGQTQGIVAVGVSASNVGRLYVGEVGQNGQLVELDLVKQWGEPEGVEETVPHFIHGTRETLITAVPDGSDTYLWRYDLTTAGISRNLTMSGASGAVHGIVRIDGKSFVSLDDESAMLELDGSSGAYASTSDSSSLSVSGDIDLRFFGAADDWDGGNQAFVAQRDSGERAYVFQIGGGGTLALGLSDDGTSTSFASASQATPFTDGTLGGLRVTWRQTDGRVQFFTADDPADPANTSWSQLGTDQTIGIPSINDSSAEVEVGSINGGTGRLYSGSVSYVEIRDGIDGTVVASPTFLGQSSGTSSFDDDQTNTWNINGGAEIVSAETGALYRETSSFASEGWLIGPLGDFFSSANKSWVSATLETGELGSGKRVNLYRTVSPDALNDDQASSWVRVTMRDTGTGDSGEIPLTAVVSRSLAGMVRLFPSTDNTQTPAVRSFGFGAYPATGDEDVIVTIPVNVSDQIERRGRARSRIKGIGGETYVNLLSFEGRPVTMRLLKPSMIVRGLVENVSTPIRSPGRRGSATLISEIRVRGRRIGQAGTTSGVGVFGTAHPFAEPPPFASSRF